MMRGVSILKVFVLKPPKFILKVLRKKETVRKEKA